MNKKFNEPETPVNTPETGAIKQPELPNSPGLCPLKVAKWAHAGGMIEKEQVDAMEAFVKGEIDYGTMRSMCG